MCVYVGVLMCWCAQTYWQYCNNVVCFMHVLCPLFTFTSAAAALPVYPNWFCGRPVWPFSFPSISSILNKFSIYFQPDVEKSSKYVHMSFVTNFSIFFFHLPGLCASVFVCVCASVRMRWVTFCGFGLLVLSVVDIQFVHIFYILYSLL